MDNLIKEYLGYLVLKGKSPLTVRNYRSYLSTFSRFYKQPAEKLTLDVIDKFQSSLAGAGISLTTQSYYLITLRSFLKYLRLRKNINTVDPLLIELPKIRRKIISAISEDEAAKLIKAAPMLSEQDTRARAILEFLMGSGIRVAELCSLTIKDIDLKEKWFRVTGKGGKQRVCFINDEMVTTLKKYLSTRRNNSIYLFTRYDNYNDNRPVTTRSIERLVKAYGVRAGIERPVTPHGLRRLFAVRLLRKNVDIRYIQEFLGHESIQTTQLYTNIERNDLERVYRLASRKVSKNVKKENEQLLVSRESFNKLRGMIGNTMRNQNEILKEIRGKKEVKTNPNFLIKTPTVN